MTQRNKARGVVAVTAAAALFVACNPIAIGPGGTGSTSGCTWASSANAGGLCTAVFMCPGGTTPGITCTGTDCVCVSTDGVAGTHFSSSAVCGTSGSAALAVYNSECAPAAATTDAGTTVGDSGTPADASTPLPPTSSVDILFEVDNSFSMEPNQAQLASQFQVLMDSLVNPPADPTTHAPQYPPVSSMHVGVISQDLGTPGSQVPSCANTDLGDNGVLNPIRNGLSVMQHEPWTSAPAGIRPAQCMDDPNQYPNFLTFDASMIVAGDTSYQDGFASDFVCNAFLSIDGCGLEAQLESAYRALVIHNPRAVAGNMDVNAGFVRDDAVLSIVIFSDEEDGSTRDCRFAELDAEGHPMACNSAISVYDAANPNWSSNDLNLRFYMYTPLGAEDPTWTLDRYIDPTNTSRGFLGLKPGHPERVLFSAITGVPLPADMPTQANGDPNWTALLGSNADGSNGLTGTAMGGEGPFSMQQANPDPNCPSRTVPACRRQGTSYDPSMAATECDATVQYFAWPSRRIVKVAQIFEDNYQNGTVSSICASDYTSALQQIAQRIQSRF